jgi:hypothetical protein
MNTLAKTVLDTRDILLRLLKEAKSDPETLRTLDGLGGGEMFQFSHLFREIEREIYECEMTIFMLRFEQIEAEKRRKRLKLVKGTVNGRE